MLVLVLASHAGYTLRRLQIDLTPLPLSERIYQSASFALVFWLSVLAVGLYQRDACRDFGVSIVRTGVAIILSFIVLSGIYYIFPSVTEWRSILVYSYGLAALGLLTTRYLFSRVVDLDGFKQRVLVIGAGRRAARMIELANDGSAHGFVIAGCLRVTGAPPVVADCHELRDLNSLCEYAVQNRADEIVTAVDERRGTLPVTALVECRLEGLSVIDFPDFMERETGKVDIDTLSPGWLLFADGFVGGRGHKILKRVFDIGVSLLFLVFSLPLLVFTAMAVKLTSKGPVFYRQERVGERGRSFRLLKFRSMRQDAESDGVPKWAARGDHRVTAVGRFIRLTRIDELPQIFNVLKGDMSFVGPRPERPFFVKSLVEQLPYYMERHEVKPGITGWAQLNFPYGSSIGDAREKLQYDLFYIKNFTMLLDFLILLQTVRVILFVDGAR